MNALSSPGRRPTVQSLRVPLGFAFAVVYVWMADPVWHWLAPGLLLAMAGLGMRIWAAGHLRKHQSLALSGPYRRTRNPLYLGSALMGFGFCMAASHFLLVGVFLILFWLIYRPVMKREEAELIDSYGEAYRRYRDAIPLFFPRLLLPEPVVSDRTFSWKQVKSNREYNAVLGFLALAAFLVIRILWR